MSQRRAPADPMAIMADVRSRVDAALTEELAHRRAALDALAPVATVLVDELDRLAAAGGSRLRPILCWLGHRAAGGADDAAVVRAAAALELLHTFALVHDDLIDGAAVRRGVPSSPVALEAARPAAARPGYGDAVALVAGDLALVLAGAMLRRSGFAPDRVDAALAIHEDAALAMAAGQVADLADPDRRGDVAARARLRGGAYSVEAPLAIGAALAGRPLDDGLAAFARDLGIAFQLRDDLDDGDAPPGVGEREVDARVDLALAHLPTDLDAEVAACLRAIASAVRPAPSRSTGGGTSGARGD